MWWQSNICTFLCKCTNVITIGRRIKQLDSNTVSAHWYQNHVCAGLRAMRGGCQPGCKLVARNLSKVSQAYKLHRHNLSFHLENRQLHNDANIRPIWLFNLLHLWQILCTIQSGYAVNLRVGPIDYGCNVNRTHFYLGLTPKSSFWQTFHREYV